jgi:hypothetical protein
VSLCVFRAPLQVARCIHSRRVAQAEFKRNGLPSVAEAGAIVATVGAASLSLIVPVAERFRSNAKSYFHQSYQQLLVFTYRSSQ